ncbi:uncharacterized protein LOC118465476 isoform X2 [Anopheles albimanus]|uniref:uncharacterized protein LOC118465476 isoform X2 n=1 Tax=Anopheles albimanus TaxID=7167 RepID=UPI0016411EB6|nr:uncharacterized protein LOC118465476 isoform X2 [Anopheles albimanus]
MMFDGFDEIAPHYERVVLKLLWWFSKLDGLKRLYFSSRAYGFREKFESTFEEAQIYYLQVLTRTDKAKILCKMLNLKLCDPMIQDEVKQKLVKVSSVLLIYFLKKLRHIPLYLTMSVEVYMDLVEKYMNFQNIMIDPSFFDRMRDQFELSNMVKAFLSLKVHILSYEKIGAPLEAADYASQVEKIQETNENALQIHELLAIRLLFNDEERGLIMSQEEEQKARLQIERIENGREKTGLVERVSDGKPIFIHRLLAEQLAALGLFRKCQEGQCNMLVFWKSKSSNIRKHLDSTLASSKPLHRAVVEQDGLKVLELIKKGTNSGMKSKTVDSDTASSILSQTDDGGRTLLHLMVLYNYEEEVPSWVPHR